MSTLNSKLNKTNLGSTTNLSVKSNSFRLTKSAGSQQQQTEVQKAKSSFGLKQHSLSKSKLNNRSTTNLNKSNLNLNMNNNQMNTLPSLIKPIVKSNFSTNLSGSTTQLTNTTDTMKRSSLIKPKNSTTSTASCLPALKSRPTSAYLSDGLNNNNKNRSKLPNNSSSKTSSNLNLNEQTNHLVKPLNTIKTATKDLSLNALKKKPTPSNSIKSTMQNLSQSASNSMIYKPYSSLSKVKLNAKDAKINLNDLEEKDKNGDKIVSKEKSLIKSNSQISYRTDVTLLDKCNIARVSPIRRQFAITNNNVKRNPNSLNSSDQEEDELDDLFDISLNQRTTSEDTNSFNSDDAKYYAILSSSEDEKLQIIDGLPRRSREREERRLRRVSGQRSSCNSSKRSSPTALDSKQSNSNNDNSKTSTPAIYESNEKLNNKKKKSEFKQHTTTKSPPTTNLNKSNSSLITTIDHKSTSLNTMFPTLNRLHNSNSIQQLNSSNSSKSVNKQEEQDYQSDDAELTLYKLKSLDFNCNSSNSNYAATKEKDGNNNSLNGDKSTDHQSTKISLNNKQTANELSTSNLNSLLNNYMSRSIGSLTGSLNGLNQSNLLSSKTCNNTPSLLPNNFRCKSPNSLGTNTANIYQSLLAPSSLQSPYSFATNTSYLSNTPHSSSTTNTIINNNVQNTTILNNVPSSFTTRLNKFGSENRGSSLSLLSACSSNYSNNLSINLNQPQHKQLQLNVSNNLLDKSTLNEIKNLRNELNRANEKANLLKSQLNTSSQMVSSFEQSLQTKTSRMKHYVLKLEEKDREIDHLKVVIENLRKTYGLCSDYHSNTNSPTLLKNLDSLSDSPNLRHSRSLNNNASSDGETVSLSKLKQSKKPDKKRSSSKKSRANSANEDTDEDTASLASVHSKDGNSTSWFNMNSFTRAFKKKSNRSKNASNQELDKTVTDLNEIKHPQHPSQLHQSYIQQDNFKQDMNELVELKQQLIEKEKCLTDERLKSLSKEDEMMKLKECLNCLQLELLNVKKAVA